METSLSWLGRLVETPGGAEWQRLSEVYGPLIASWVEHANVNAADIDDVVQEVLIVVVKRVHEFEHQRPGAFRAWLRTILSIQLKKYFRENPRLNCNMSLDAICDPTSDNSKRLDREHDAYLVVRAMKLIEHEFQPITWISFHLHVVENKRPQDVAAMLEISVNAVIKAKSRVLKRLREMLSECASAP